MVKSVEHQLLKKHHVFTEVPTVSPFHVFFSWHFRTQRDEMESGTIPQFAIAKWTAFIVIRYSAAVIEFGAVEKNSQWTRYVFRWICCWNILFWVHPWTHDMDRPNVERAHYVIRTSFWLSDRFPLWCLTIPICISLATSSQLFQSTSSQLLWFYGESGKSVDECRFDAR